MTNPYIARQRLANQQLSASTFTTPTEIVRWMGAVQSQDYPGAKWAVGQRARVSELAVEQAISEGSILRLHVLRPTWHFVAAEDVRWLLDLTTSRVKAGWNSRLRELGIHEAAIERSQAIFRQALAGGNSLTRDELASALNQGGVSTAVPQSLPHLLGRGELDQVLCSGPDRLTRTGVKQTTYTLLEERVPLTGSPALPFDPIPAAAELVRRYFTSHGPASLKDFSWWSGLTLTDARAGIELAGDSLARQEIDGQIYWGPRAPGAPVALASARNAPGAEPPASSAPAAGARAAHLSAPRPVTAGAPAAQVPPAYLLPAYDEYVVAYTNRDAVFDPARSSELSLRGGVLTSVVIIDGLVVGGWQRQIKKSEVVVTVEPLDPLTPEQEQAVEQAVERYGIYLGLPARVQRE